MQVASSEALYEVAKRVAPRGNLGGDTVPVLEARFHASARRIASDGENPSGLPPYIPPPGHCAQRTPLGDTR